MDRFDRGRGAGPPGSIDCKVHRGRRGLNRVWMETLDAWDWALGTIAFDRCDGVDGDALNAPASGGDASCMIRRCSIPMPTLSQCINHNTRTYRSGRARRSRHWWCSGPAANRSGVCLDWSAQSSSSIGYAHPYRYIPHSKLLALAARGIDRPHPLRAKMFSAAQSQTERAFIEAGVAQDVRADGRGRADYRWVGVGSIGVVVPGVSSHESGSRVDRPTIDSHPTTINLHDAPS